MGDYTVPDTTEAVAEAAARVPRLLVLLALTRAAEAITRDAPVPGSLIDPGRDARRHFAATYHRDPPLFHDWLTGEFLRYVRCGCDPTRWLRGEGS